MSVTFENEEKRLEALQALPEEMPMDYKGTPEEWSDSLATQIEEIQKAPIGSEGQPEGQPAAGTPDERLSSPPADDKTPPPDDKWMRRAETLERENAMMRDEFNEKVNKTVAEWEEKLKAVTTKEPEPQPQPKETRYDRELQDAAAKLTAVKRELASMTDKLDEKYIEKVNEKAELAITISDLRSKIFAEEHSMSKAELAKMRKEAEERAKRDEEMSKAREASEKQKTESQRMLQEIADFRKGKDEFKSEKKYEQMFNEFDSFATDVAAAYWNKPAHKVTPEDKEIAVQKYKQNSPALMEDIKKRGVEPPKDLDKYLLLSQVNYLKRGWVLDEYTGKWKKYTDGAGNQVNFPTMEDAYDHLMKMTGKSKEALIKAQMEGAKGAAEAMSRRADPKELGSQYQGGMPETPIAMEEAAKMLKNFDESEMALASRDTPPNKPLPPKVQLYVRYLKALRIDPAQIAASLEREVSEIMTIK